jgi:hypothetical protein
MEYCIGQAYDGAANMSGKHNGAAAIIRSKYPQAVYVHCKAHQLNLALMKSCTSVKEIGMSHSNLFISIHVGLILSS